MFAVMYVYSSVMKFTRFTALLRVFFRRFTSLADLESQTVSKVFVLDSVQHDVEHAVKENARRCDAALFHTRHVQKQRHNPGHVAHGEESRGRYHQRERRAVASVTRLLLAGWRCAWFKTFLCHRRMINCFPIQKIRADNEQVKNVVGV